MTAKDLYEYPSEETCFITKINIVNIIVENNYPSNISHAANNYINERLCKIFQGKLLIF